MQKYFTILLFLLSTNFYAFSQDVYANSQKQDPHKIDILRGKLPALKNSERVDCLNEISEAYLPYFPLHPDFVKAYAHKALKEAEEINYIPGKAKAYKNLGRIECLLITDLPSAEKYFSKSLELFIKTGDEQQIGWAWGALGLSKWVLSKFPEAMEAFGKAVQLFEKAGDTSSLKYTCRFMGTAELESGHYAKSLQYAFKVRELTGEDNYGMLSGIYRSVGDNETALEYMRKIKADTAWGQFKYLGLAGIFSQIKQYDSAFYYYRLFTDYARKLGAGSLIKLSLGLGSLHLALKHYDTALAYATESLKISKRGNDKNQVMNGLLLLSKIYKEMGNYKKSIPLAQELLQTARETGARQHIRDAHFLLYELFEHLKKKNSAYHHLRQYTALKDSVELDLSAQKLAIYKTKSEREQALARINSLNEEKKLQQQQLKQTALQKKMLIAGITALLLIGVVLFRNVLLKRKNEKHLREIAENELKIQKLETQKQLTELEMQALRAQMNPHFIFNCLNAINGYILINESETAADYLTKFSRLIRMVLNNSQKQLISLEDELETLSLYLHMESLRFKDNFHYEIKCDSTIDRVSLFIPPMLLQPFVENAIWHGLMHKDGFRELNIELHFEKNILNCNITDNGVGRKVAAGLRSKSAEKNKSMGMEITKNRMALLNQELNGECFF